ncbi:hypothetical protein ACJIZ3_023033 [Penstemon smallii]|uniref:DUF7722 domain-containing protein n=1 Tax=Penstemon smallii TaxID=265156 RepID=A0ABD3TMX6_9LAMI
MGSQEKSSEFKMPLHYPRYTKKEYQDMPEWMVDRLLAEYGLPATGNLAQKRGFAMGAFLWPTTINDKYNPPSKSSQYYSKINGVAASLIKKKNV